MAEEHTGLNKCREPRSRGRIAIYWVLACLLPSIATAFTPTELATKGSSSVYARSQNAFYVTDPALAGQCTWYAYGRVVELADRGELASSVKAQFVAAFWDTSGRDAKIWPAFLGGTWYDTNTATLPVDKRRAGLLAVWVGGDHGHVGFVEEVSADKATYRLSDYNRGLDESLRDRWYSFSGTSDLLLGVYPRFLELALPSAGVPLAPTPVFPVAGTTVTNGAPTFDWQDVPGQTWFRVTVYDDAAGTHIVAGFNYSAQSAASQWIFPSSLPDGRYWWQVNAANATGNGPYCALQPFVVLSNPPAAPTPVSPVGGATVASSTPTFDWQDVPDQTWFRVTVYDDATGSHIATGFNYTAQSAASQWTFPTSLPDGSYWWQVNAANAAGNGPYCALQSFRVSTRVPAAPTPLSPVGGATMATGTPTFDWQDVADQTWFRVTVYDDAAATHVVPGFNYSAESTASQWTFPTSLTDGSYWWQVNVANAAGDGPYCPLQSFRVQRTGSIRVSVTPQAAADAGAQWRLTGSGEWHHSGEIVGGLPLGSYEVTFSALAGWVTPAARAVTVGAAQPDIWVDGDPYLEGVTWYLLRLVSVNTSGGISVDANPPDSAGLGAGTTPFTRRHAAGTTVTLSAPTSVDGSAFVRWRLDGTDGSTEPTTTVHMDSDHALTAVYQAVADSVVQAFTWQSRASLPVALSGSAVAVHGGRIHVIGGSQLLKHYRYDPVVDQYVALAALPGNGISEGGAAVIGDRIFAVHNPFDDRMRIYNTATDAWTTGSAMPTSRRSPSVAAVGGKVYAMGGLDASLLGFSAVEAYDPANDSWSTRTPMPTARGGAATAVVGDVVYVMGGRNDAASGVTAVTESYTAATDTWVTRASMGHRRVGAAAAVMGGRVYVIGGFDGANYVNVIEEYDPQADTWRALTQTTTARIGAVAAAIDGEVYLIGGYNDHDGTVASTEYGVPVYRSVTNQAPTAHGQAVTTEPGVVRDIGLGGSDPEGDSLAFSVVAHPTHGTVSLRGASASYAPAAGFHGTDSFTFTVSDGSLTAAAATVLINVNSRPVLAPVAERTASVGERLTIALSASDADADSLSYSATGSPTGAVLSGRVFTWTPTSDQVGTHSLQFNVADGYGATDSALTAITVRTGPGSPTVTVALPGGATMDFRWVPPGTFTMGDASDGPAHQVTLTSGYYLARTEITQAQWYSVMATRPWVGYDYVQDSANNPAVCISWSDVQHLVHALNQATGDSLYRLPTEAEWEYACRAGTTSAWSFGDDQGQLGQYAWYSANAWALGLRWAQPVATKAPNPWGLFDMHGNVWEWVQDWWGPYDSSPVTDPRGPQTGSNHVDRGGGFAYGADGTRSALRSYYTPGYRDEPYIGARLLLMAAPPAANTAPHSDAGPDRAVTVGATVRLDGGASTDADGDSLTYSWTSLNGIALTAAAPREIAFIAPMTTGRYLFTLVVNDGSVDSAPDTVVVTVAEAAVGSPATQVLNLANGFNLVSWRVDTANDSIAAIVRPILPVLLQVSGFEAAALNPNTGSGVGAKLYNPSKPAFVSTLKMTDHRLAYWVKVSAPVELTVAGITVAPQTAIPLSVGANLVAYLPAFTDSVRHAVSSIPSGVTQVTGFETARHNPNSSGGAGAKLYSPSKPAFVSTMKYMAPGLGYWLKLASGASGSLIYPSSSVASTGKATASAAESRTQVAPTSQWMWLWGRLRFGAAPAPVGTLVDVIDGDGQVAGAAEVTEAGVYGALAVYLDDPETTADEGAAEGEWLTVRVDGSRVAQVQWTAFDDVVELDLVKVATAANDDVTRPAADQLWPSRPNPFNAQTTVSYDLAQASEVSLVVYNLSGQRVRNLVRQYQAPGAHAVAWDGLDDGQLPVASGVYLVRLSTGLSEHTTRVMLLK